MDMTEIWSMAGLLPGLLASHGVQQAVLSPGARCASLSIALERSPQIRCVTVVSEHTAAFMALGICISTGRPVALICTSGSALLNYAPALAEAYRRQAPLIVISADRPPQWIGQADGQTMVQSGALAGVVKRSFQTGEAPANEYAWWLGRTVNEAMITALTPPCGPVHINIPIDLSHPAPDIRGYVPRPVSVVRPKGELTTAEARVLGAELQPPRRVLVVVSQMSPDAVLNKAILRLTHIPNVAVLTELYANIHAPLAVNLTDTLMRVSDAARQERLTPDVILTVGSGIVSGTLKSWLRSCHRAEHWHIGYDADMCDTFALMTRRVEMDPGLFMRQLASAMQPWSGDASPESYAAQWRTAGMRADRMLQSFVDRAAWSDLKAMALIGRALPARWNVQVSNGMCARYAMLTLSRFVHRVDCNRGISGIEGSTSTAVGAAMTYPHGTLLITGDMSAIHDSGPLASRLLPAGFVMVVMCNGGGNIFRCVQSTCHYPETPALLCAEPLHVDWKALATAAGARYCEAGDAASLRARWAEITAHPERPTLLIVNTNAETDAAVWHALSQIN